MKTFAQACLDRIKLIDATRAVDGGDSFDAKFDRLILDALLDAQLQRPSVVSDVPTFIELLVYDYKHTGASDASVYAGAQVAISGWLQVVSVEPPIGTTQDGTAVSFKANGRVFVGKKYAYVKSGDSYEVDGTLHRVMGHAKDDEFEGPSDPGVVCRPRYGNIVGLQYSRVRTEYGVLYDTYALPGIKRSAKVNPDGVEDFDTDSLAPFDPDKKAAFLYSKTDGGLFLAERSFYGNLHSASLDGKRTVSWRGTPTRHFRLPSDTTIPGVTHVERSPSQSWGEDVPEFTSFWTELYELGEVSKLAPRYSWPKGTNDVDGRCLIYGALVDDAGRTYIVTLCDHQNAPTYVIVFSDGHRLDTDDSTAKTKYLAEHENVTVRWERQLAKPGFFLTLWVGGDELDGWNMVSERSYSRNGLPWFPNQTNTALECTNGDQLALDGTFTPYAVTTTGYWHENGDLVFDATYSSSKFVEEGRAGQVALTFHAGTTAQSTPDKVKVYDGSYSVMRRKTMPVVEGPSTWSYAPDYYLNYTAHGGEGPYVFTYPGSSGCAGPGHDAAIGRVTVTDCKGNTGFKEVRLPGGTWVYSHTVGNCSSYCNDYGMPGWHCEVVGLQMICYNFYWGGFGSLQDYENANVSESVSMTYGFDWYCGGNYVGHVSGFPWKSSSPGPLHWEWDWLMGACGRRAPFGACGGCGVCGSEMVGATLWSDCHSYYDWVCP